MAHRETNPQFLPPQPLHSPPRHHPGSPLGQWSGLAQQPQPGRDPHGPRGPWGVLSQQQSAPKLKKQKRAKDSQSTPTTPIKKNSHPSGAAAVRVPTQQEHQGPHPPPEIPLPDPIFNQQELRPSRPQPHPPKPQRTHPLTWLAALFCAICGIIIILGGLAFLVVYLLLRPKSPQFDIPNAKLNAASLDMGYLLNADIALLLNFTNPNKNVRLDFSAMYLDLVFEDTPIATTQQYNIPPFKVAKRQSELQWIPMNASQVALTTREGTLLQKQIKNNGVVIFVRGKFRARSNFGSLLRYSNWVHAYCTLTLSGPPAGVLKGRDCRTEH